jgi:23S rRNA (guanosine2251-2'-O)-methyltransferase
VTASDRLICGLQPVREAIRKHGSALGRVLVEAGGQTASPQLDALARFARDHGALVERPPRSELDRLAQGIRHQGAMAFAPELVIRRLHELELGDAPLVVALDELQDPQNFGAIVRSSVAMGATAIVWPEHSSAPLSPATFRASAGAVEHATLCRVTSLPHALEQLAEKGLVVVGLDMAGETTIDRVDLTGPAVLVAGAEGKGLRKTVKRACATVAKLPMAGPLGSLNASVSVAIGLYEAVRQRATMGR